MLPDRRALSRAIFQVFATIAAARPDRRAGDAAPESCGCRSALFHWRGLPEAPARFR
jgi:hypothetical protein